MGATAYNSNLVENWLWPFSVRRHLKEVWKSWIGWKSRCRRRRKV